MPIAQQRKHVRAVREALKCALQTISVCQRLSAAEGSPVRPCAYPIAAIMGVQSLLLLTSSFGSQLVLDWIMVGALKINPIPCRTRKSFAFRHNSKRLPGRQARPGQVCVARARGLFLFPVPLANIKCHRNRGQRRNIEPLRRGDRDQTVK